MNRLAILLLVLLASCENTTPRYGTDQVMRQRLFKECMAALPKGPEKTTYNDWDEVVEACDSVAYWQARVCLANCGAAEIAEQKP